MIYLFFNNAFFYLPISLVIYAIVNEVAKRTIYKNVEVSGFRHTIAIICIALFSSATALGLAVILDNSELLPQSDEQNSFIVGGLPLIYSTVSAYITRTLPIGTNHSTNPEIATPLHKATMPSNSNQLKFLASGLAIALVVALFYIYTNSKPKNFDECVIKNTQSAQTQAAVAVIRTSCRNLFPRFTFRDASNPFGDSRLSTDN